MAVASGTSFEVGTPLRNQQRKEERISVETGYGRLTPTPPQALQPVPGDIALLTEVEDLPKPFPLKLTPAPAQGTLKEKTHRTQQDSRSIRETLPVEEYKGTELKTPGELRTLEISLGSFGARRL
jgi:hypothetical protein